MRRLTSLFQSVFKIVFPADLEHIFTFGVKIDEMSIESHIKTESDHQLNTCSK